MLADFYVLRSVSRNKYCIIAWPRLRAWGNGVCVYDCVGRITMHSTATERGTGSHKTMHIYDVFKYCQKRERADVRRRRRNGMGYGVCVCPIRAGAQPEVSVICYWEMHKVYCCVLCCEGARVKRDRCRINTSVFATNVDMFTLY